MLAKGKLPRVLMAFTAVYFIADACAVAPTMSNSPAAATAPAKVDELQREIREFHITRVAMGPIGHWGTTLDGGDVEYLVYKGGDEEVYNSLFIQWHEIRPGTALLTFIQN